MPRLTPLAQIGLRHIFLALRQRVKRKNLILSDDGKDKPSKYNLRCEIMNLSIKNYGLFKKPRLGTVRQDFEMDQTQPTLQCLHSSFALKISLAQTPEVGPKNMGIYVDYIPEF